MTSVERGLAAYSCGGSQGIGFRRSLTLFPLASLHAPQGRMLGTIERAHHKMEKC